MRALTNNLVSGRLMQLEYEITPENVQDLVGIKGIGQLSVDKMKEFFKRDDRKCQRIDEYENSQEGMAKRTLKWIWGVGDKHVR